MLKTAGILTIIGGCYGIGIGALVTVGGGIVGAIEQFVAMEEMAGLGGILAGIGGGLIGLGVVALIGGIFALKRKLWGLALAGTICAIPLVPLGTVLGIISLIFVLKRRREFA